MWGIEMGPKDVTDKVAEVILWELAGAQIPHRLAIPKVRSSSKVRLLDFIWLHHDTLLPLVGLKPVIAGRMSNRVPHLIVISILLAAQWLH